MLVMTILPNSSSCGGWRSKWRRGIGSGRCSRSLGVRPDQPRPDDSNRRPVPAFHSEPRVMDPKGKNSRLPDQNRRAFAQVVDVQGVFDIVEQIAGNDAFEVVLPDRQPHAEQIRIEKTAGAEDPILVFVLAMQEYADFRVGLAYVHGRAD